MTAVTGVRAHQTMLDVTGNNIANVNTTGFKKDVTIFQDLLYQTSSGATGPGDNIGGVNPVQVGLGVKVAAIETIHSQGAAQYTGNKSDVMIEGEGYFIFSTGSGANVYGRAGNFYVGPETEYRLTHSGTGYLVQGYQMERDPLNPLQFNTGSELGDIRIPIGTKMEARATTVAAFKCNLDSRSDVYLPIGFKDIPWADGSGNGEHAQIMMNGQSYDVTVTTDLTSTNGQGYLTYTFDTVPPGTGTGLTLVFDMVGTTTDPDGKTVPKLEINTTSSTMLGAALPGGTLQATPTFDAVTGTLKFTDSTPPTPTNALLWETNLYESMSYQSFSVTGTGGQNYTVIAEFDESTLTNRDAPVDMILWFDDGTGTMTPVQTKVSFKSDGTFDTVTITGTLPGGFTAGTDFEIVPTANGNGLEIKAANLTTGAPMSTVGQITMGGIHQTKMTVYDCQGYAYTMEVQFKKVSENTWRWEVFFPDYPNLVPTPSSGELVFDNSCLLLKPETVDINVPYSLLGRDNGTITLDFSGKTFGLDKMEGITQFASETTTKGYYQDGYEMGVMNNYSIGQDGIITGQYTNGQNMPLYRLALAQFANPMGLDQVGDTMFAETINSGKANINAATVNGAGKTQSGYLEGSNVDLTEEFTHLIIAQRGFQANTRVITVSDQILEEVVNLKR
jgi:flagellar hook protein FlgE